ncbi:MAG: hypothetical protein M0R48_02355 [Candidatus Omnitrophica bacterium]|jgi:lipopolysaccharide assembly outer membrane protein LptD (OstA)|nr:hypothetical protein [Candidatus Omnitrophota bacterium]
MKEIFNKIIFTIAIFAFLSCFPFLAFPQEKVLPVEINGDEINYVQADGTVLVKGHVKLKYKEMVITCDEASYNANTNIANLKSNVKIVRKDTTIYGETVVYDFNSQNAKMVNMRIVSPPVYGKATSAGSEGSNKYVLTGGYITTCDLEKPHYKLMAKQIIAYPKVKIVAKNVVMKVGEIPVFYFPYLAVPLKDKSFPFMIVPGSSNDWGSYVLGRWRYHLNDQQRGRIILDWYEKRGVGYGISHHVESKKYGEALVNYYNIEDDLYKLGNREELFDRYPERKSIDPKYLQDDRYKAQFSHSWQPTENLSLLSEFNKFSDEFFMKDFFTREYEIEPHPLSYNLTTYSFPNSSLSLLTQARANHFFSEVEYLPQLEYDFYQQTLGQTGLYFQSKTTAGSLAQKTANSGLGESSGRVYTNNVLSRPQNFFGWLYINPYIGNYSSFYSKTLVDEENIWRTTPTAGADVSTKLYKIFNTNFNFFGTPVKNMRHIVTPTITYAYTRPPTVANSKIIQFDAIDNLARNETVTVTLYNKLQARNNEKVWDFLYFSPSFEFQINRKEGVSFFDETGNTVERRGTYLNRIKSDLEIYFADGVSFNGNTDFDALTNVLKEANADLTFRDVKKDKYSVSVGHRYAVEYGSASDPRMYSSQSTLDFEYQLTQKLRFKNYLRYEYKTGAFEEQQYALRQDLHCWWMDVGVDVDRQREGVTDLTFWVAFTLKDFPDLHIGFDQTYSGAKKTY